MSCISLLLNSCSCVCLVCWKPNEVAIQYGSRLPEQPPVYAGHRTAPCVCRAQNSPLCMPGTEQPPVYAGHRTAPCVCRAQNSPLCMPGTEQSPVYAGHRTAPCVCRAQNSPLCMPGTVFSRSLAFLWYMCHIRFPMKKVAGLCWQDPVMEMNVTVGNVTLG